MALREPPLVIEDAGDVRILGSVHTLRDNVPHILREIEGYSPDVIFIELKDASQATGSKDIEAIRRLCKGSLECVDRPVEISSARYYSGTPTRIFLYETMIKFLFLPLNVLSNMTYNALPGLYKKITGGDFFTFGWSEYDSKAYIFERDEFMAGKTLSIIKNDRDRGVSRRYLLLSGRRHVPGISAIIEVFRLTGDIGSYYAGGKMYDVFRLDRLSEPYFLDHAKSQDNFIKNRLVEKLVAAIIFPVFAFAIFAVLTLTFLAVATILYAIVR